MEEKLVKVDTKQEMELCCKRAKEGAIKQREAKEKLETMYHEYLVQLLVNYYQLKFEYFQEIESDFFFEYRQKSYDVMEYVTKTYLSLYLLQIECIDVHYFVHPMQICEYVRLVNHLHHEGYL